MSAALQGKVAVVTGASRGVGKGIALGLAEAGATVYVTGRSVEERSPRFPGTITRTAQEVAHRGGKGIAVRCDHSDDAQVEALFNQVREEQARLDILVNNAFATPAEHLPTGIPFWELSLSLWDQLHQVGFRSHYVASVLAAPLMIAQRSGLILNVSSAGAVHYFFNVPYHAAKAGVDRMTIDMAHELRPHNVAVVSLWPPLTRTEEVLSRRERYDLSQAVSALFNGHVAAALAADPNIMEKSGRAWRVADLAREYGLKDPESTAS